MSYLIGDYLIKLSEEEIENDNKLWKKSNKFYKIRKLMPDQKGRIGEHFLKYIFEQLNMKVEYENNKCGDYDLIVDNIKIEVKFATLDSAKKFQHEGIKNSKKWDMIAFIDIAPEKIYVTFINRDKFTFSEKKSTCYLNGKIINLSCRGKDNVDKKATGVGYKATFSLKKLFETKTIKDIENLFNESKKNYQQ